MRRSGKSKRRTGRVRIVAGKWRHRLISVAKHESLRPTPDRVRETLFNWLQPWLSGARVLDLYAGSGILGIEALSRGAAAVTFVESDARLAAEIGKNLQTLDGLGDATIVCDDVGQFLSGAPAPVSIAFLDPPYAAAEHAELCRKLAAGWLMDDARIYLEQHAGDRLPGLPEGFEIEKNKQAGQVRYLLARFGVQSRRQSAEAK